MERCFFRSFQKKILNITIQLDSFIIFFQAGQITSIEKIQIKYNKDIPNMYNFVVNVLKASINVLQIVHGLVVSTIV